MGKRKSPLASAASPLDASVHDGCLYARNSAVHPKSSVCPAHPRASSDIFLGSQGREQFTAMRLSKHSFNGKKLRDTFFCWKFFVNYFCLGKHDIILMVRKQTGRPAFCYS